MIELRPDNYERIRPLLLGMDFHLVGRSFHPCSENASSHLRG